MTRKFDMSLCNTPQMKIEPVEQFVSIQKVCDFERSRELEELLSDCKLELRERDDQLAERQAENDQVKAFAASERTRFSSAMSKLQAANKRLEDDLVTKAAEKSKSEQLLNSLRAEKLEFEAQVSKLAKAVDDEKLRTQAAVNELTVSRTTISTLEKQLEKELATASAANQKAALFKELLDRKDKELEGSKVALKKFTAEKVQLEARIKELKLSKDTSSIKQEGGGSLGSGSKAQRAAQIMIDSLQKKIGELKEEVEDWRNKCQELENEVFDTTRSLRNAERERANVEEKLKKHLLKTPSIGRELEAEITKRRKAEEECAEAESKIEKLEQEKNELEDKKEQYSDKVKDFKDQLELKKQKIIKLQQKKRKLKRDVESSSTIIKKREQTIAEFNLENSKLKREIVESRSVSTQKTSISGPHHLNSNRSMNRESTPDGSLSNERRQNILPSAANAAKKQIEEAFSSRKRSRAESCAPSSSGQKRVSCDTPPAFKKASTPGRGVASIPGGVSSKITFQVHNKTGLNLPRLEDLLRMHYCGESAQRYCNLLFNGLGFQKRKGECWHVIVGRHVTPKLPFFLCQCAGQAFKRTIQCFVNGTYHVILFESSACISDKEHSRDEYSKYRLEDSVTSLLQRRGLTNEESLNKESGHVGHRFGMDLVKINLRPWFDDHWLVVCANLDLNNFWICSSSTPKYEKKIPIQDCGQYGIYLCHFNHVRNR